jgi:tRNA 2-thiouridine synthesizing protein D
MPNRPLPSTKEVSVAVLIVVNTTPYGTEGPYNALRLTEALITAGEWVDLFLMGDGVHAARRGQQPREAHKSVEDLLAQAIAAGASITACGACCRTRGLEQQDLIEGVRLATIHELAALVSKNDKLLSF